MSEEKHPWKICRVGGREFKIYREYDDLVEHDVGIYPEFAERPEYTAEGRPFSTAEREGCLHYKPEAPGKPISGDCGGCGWFCREEAFAIIGVCMCDALRLTPKESLGL